MELGKVHKAVNKVAQDSLLNQKVAFVLYSVPILWADEMFLWLRWDQDVSLLTR